MQLTEMTFPGTQPIEGYGLGFFRIAGAIRQGPQIFLPEKAMDWQGLDDPAPLIALASQLDVLFLGIGAEMRPLPRPFREACEAAGLPIELMATPTACRTYNVMLSEGRRIGAAVLPV